MVAISAFLANSSSGASLALENQGGTQSPHLTSLTKSAPISAVNRFETAMTHAGSVTAQPVGAQSSPGAPTSPAITRVQDGPDRIGNTYSGVGNTNNLPRQFAANQTLQRERALRGLELSRPSVSTPGNVDAADSRGDAILDGLSHLRSTFDSHTSRINDISTGVMKGEGQLLAIQVEIIKYSLLIDVTSKLTGKSTQTFDTLMKGQ